MRTLIVVFLLAGIGTIHAQTKKVTFKVSPVGLSKISIDGEEQPMTASLTKVFGFNERKGISEHEVEIKAPGYQTQEFIFTVDDPNRQKINVLLERKLPSLDSVPAFTVEIDRITSAIDYSTDVGENYKWPHRFENDIPLDIKKDVMNQVLKDVGFETTGYDDNLFEVDAKDLHLPDVLIAGRVGYFRLSKLSPDGIYVPNVYFTKIRIDWQVYDRHDNHIILKESVESTFSVQTRTPKETLLPAVIDNLYAFLGKKEEVLVPIQSYDLDTALLAQEEEVALADSMAADSLETDTTVGLDSMSIALDSTSIDSVGVRDSTPMVEEQIEAIYHFELPKRHASMRMAERPDSLSEMNEEVLLERLQSATVKIKVDELNETGSGIVTSSDGFIVTSLSCVANAHLIDVTFTNGLSLPAEIVETAPSLNLALLKVRGVALNSLAISSDSSNVDRSTLYALDSAEGLMELEANPENKNGVQLWKHELNAGQTLAGRALIDGDGAIRGILFPDEGIQQTSLNSVYVFKSLGLHYVE